MSETEIVMESATRPNVITYAKNPSIDDLRANKYSIMISGLKESDKLLYPITSWTHPSMSVAPIRVDFKMNPTFVPSNVTEFGNNVTFEFSIMTDMALYYHINKEMRNQNGDNVLYQRDSNSIADRIKRANTNQSDNVPPETMLNRRFTISLMIMDNSNNIVREIRYSNCFFTDLGELNFLSVNSTPPILTTTASFQFDWWDFE